jgi:hypothetical protein
MRRRLIMSTSCKTQHQEKMAEAHGLRVGILIDGDKMVSYFKIMIS